MLKIQMEQLLKYTKNREILKKVLNYNDFFITEKTLMLYKILLNALNQEEADSNVLDYLNFKVSYEDLRKQYTDEWMEDLILSNKKTNNK